MNIPEQNKMEFGRWASSIPGEACQYRILFESPPHNEIEAIQHGNALANTGNYPIGTSECFNVGISGGCGIDCFVYLKGMCEEPDEFLDHLSESELKHHKELYPIK